MDFRGFLGRRRSSLDSSSRSDSSRQSFSSFSSCKQSPSAELASDNNRTYQQQHQRQSQVRIRSNSLDDIDFGSNKNSNNNDDDDDDDCSLDFPVEYNKHKQQHQQQQQKNNNEDMSMRTITTLRDESTNSFEYELLQQQQHHHHHHQKTQQQQQQRHATGYSIMTATAAKSTSAGEDDKRDKNSSSSSSDKSKKTTTTTTTATTPGGQNHRKHCSAWTTIASFRELCGHFINDNRIQVSIIFLIVVNALMMGLGTFDFVTENHHVQTAFETTDKVFLTIFTLEIGMQFVYHGLQLFMDGWLLFDFLIIVVSWSFNSLQVIRAFRIFRAIRLVTRLQILKNLVQAIFDVAPSLMAILALLMLVLYIYAVMCTVLFKNLYEMGVTDIDYFGRLDKTLFSLFEMMTLEGWGHIVRQVMTEYYWAPFIFLSFLVFSSFILYSLIIAVVCDAVTETEHHKEYERAELAKEETKQHIKYLEQRIQEMSHQQAILLKSLQQVMEQVELQPQPSKSTVKPSSSWRWSGRSSDQ